MYVVPATPEDLVDLIQRIPDEISRVAVYPLDEVGKFGKGSRHKKRVGKFGVSKPVIVLADEPMQVGSAASWIGYDKDGLLDLHFPVPEKEYLVEQPEKEVDDLIEEKLENEKDGQ